MWNCISLCFQAAFFWINVKFSIFQYVYWLCGFPVGEIVVISLMVLYYVNLARLDLCFPESLSLYGSSLELAKLKVVWDLEGRSEAAGILLWRLLWFLTWWEIDAEMSVVSTLSFLFPTIFNSSSWLLALMISRGPKPPDPEAVAFHRPLH